MSRVGQSLDVGSELKEDVWEEVKDDSLKEESEEKVSVSSNVLLDVEVNVFRRFGFLFVLLFLILVTFWSLSRSFYIPVIDERAEFQVGENFRQLAVQEVFSKYPHATREELQVMVNQALVEGKQSGKYQAFVASTIERYKEEYRDDGGVTYLYTPDSFYYFRLARNLLENGHLGTEMKRDEVFDSLRFAPDGDWPSFSVMPYSLLYFYKLWLLWDSDVPLEYTTFLFPVVVGILSVCIVFLIGWKIDGVLTGAFSGFVLAVHPLFVLFNYGGYSDTQVLVFFLSSLLVLLLLCILDYSRPLCALCSLPLFFVVLYVLRNSWSGWFFMLVIFVLAVVVWSALFLIHIAMKKNDWKQYVLLVLLLCFSLYGSFWFSHSLFFEQALERLSVENIAESIFPTAFDSVLELQGMRSVKRFVDVLGGPVLVIVFFVQLGVICYSAIKKVPRFEYILLLSWTILLMVSGVRALRFMYLVLPAFVLFTGLGLSNVVRWFPEVLERFHFGKNVPLTKVVGVGVVFFLVFVFVREDVFTQSTSFPAGNDAIYEAGKWLQKNSRSDAIIASWWDLGYVWQVASRRATLFDGGLFNTPYLFWVSRILSYDDSLKARGVLEALGCGQRLFLTYVQEGTDYVGDYNQNVVEKERFLKSSIFEVFSDRSFGNVDLRAVESTHCSSPREVYVAIDQDMLYKMSLYGLYGGWDFETSKYAKEVKNLSYGDAINHLVGYTNLSEQEASVVLSKLDLQESQEVVPVKMSKLSRCVSSGEVVRCDNDFRINLSGMDARMNGVHPRGLVVVNSGERSERFYDDSKGGYSVVLFNTSDGWRSVLMDTELTNTLVVRMFVGENVLGFDKVFESREEPERVVVYKPLFRRESLGGVPFTVPLSELSAKYFYFNLLINFSEGNHKLLFDSLSACSTANFSNLLNMDLTKEKFFYYASRNGTCSVSEFIGEIENEKSRLLTLDVPLSENAHFFINYFRNMSKHDTGSAIIRTLQNLVGDEVLSIVSNHSLADAVAIGTNNTNITAKLFAEELKKVLS